jgi:hypothetical protein
MNEGAEAAEGAEGTEGEKLLTTHYSLSMTFSDLSSLIEIKSL